VVEEEAEARGAARVVDAGEPLAALEGRGAAKVRG
jgi:hypothetical protein